MPRKSKIFNDFSGGFVDGPSPRDLKDSESTNAVDVDISQPGLLKMAKGFTDITSYSGIDSTDIEDGYGLFFFSSDYDYQGNETETDYFVIAGKSSTPLKIFQIMDTSGNFVSVSGSDFYTLSTTNPDSTDFYPAFYFVDGVLRVSDGNMGSSNSEVGWASVINRTHFTDASKNSTTYSGWWWDTAKLAEPTRGLCLDGSKTGTPDAAASTSTNLEYTATTPFSDMITEIPDHIVAHTGINKAREITAYVANDQVTTDALDGGDEWDGATPYIFPPDNGVGVNLEITPVQNSSTDLTVTIADGIYDFGISYTYDGTQEGGLFQLVGDIDLVNNSGTAPWAFNVRVMMTGAYDRRISAVNVYFKDQSSNNSEWNYLCSADMEKGLIINEEAEKYAAWSDLDTTITGSGDAPTDKYITSVYTYPDAGVGTHESRSGIVYEGRDVHARFAAATIANRSAYIGNVRINGKNLGDTILKSPANRFDIFTEDRKIEVTTNDGDHITALMSYADRILEFKKKKLNIINVSQGIEFLESQNDFMGIEFPCQAILTTNGVAWANENGCYLFNGNSIIDLLRDPQDPSRRRIELSAWRTFIGSKPILGYSSKDHFLHIKSSSGDIRNYDMVSGGWVQLESEFASDDYSNFVSNNDNVACILKEDKDIMCWDESTRSTSANFHYSFRDFYGDSTLVDKRLKRVIVVHKNSDNNVQLFYSTDRSLTETLIGTLSDSSTWISQEFTIDPIASFKSIRFILRSTGTTPNDFEFDSLEAIYRPKGMR